MASDASEVTLTATAPGTINTPERTTGSAGAMSATFMGQSQANTSQVVVQIKTNGAPNTPTVDNKGVVQITVPASSGTMGTTNYLLVKQTQAITNNWSFDVNVSVAGGGNGGGTLTFAKGTGGGGDKKK